MKWEDVNEALEGIAARLRTTHIPDPIICCEMVVFSTTR